MDIIRDELERNNINHNIILHIRAFLRQNTLDHVVSTYHDGVLLPCVYRHMKPINFGRIISYLGFVYKVSNRLDEQTIREAVRVTLYDLRDFFGYKRKGRRFLFTVLQRIVLDIM